MSAQSDILELFPWITTNFVQSLLEKSERNKSVLLKSFNAKKCFNDGENFSNHMIGLKVVFEHGNDSDTKQRDFLIKIAIQTKEFTKLNEECLIYEREIAANTMVVPAVEKLLESVGVHCIIAPRYLFEK